MSNIRSRILKAIDDRGGDIQKARLFVSVFLDEYELFEKALESLMDDDMIVEDSDIEPVNIIRRI